MKKLRICLEIDGLAVDEYGEPCAGGLSMTLGEVPEEKYDALIEILKTEEVLKLACLDTLFDVSDCRIITPEEYDRVYGDVED